MIITKSNFKQFSGALIWHKILTHYAEISKIIIYGYFSGYWRGLDFDFEGQVLSHILDLRDEENWSFDDIPIESCVSTLGSLYER